MMNDTMTSQVWTGSRGACSSSGSSSIRTAVRGNIYGALTCNFIKVLQAKPGYHRVEPQRNLYIVAQGKINGEECSRPVESHLHISHDSLQYIFSPTQFLLTVSAIIVLHYCYFFIKSRRYKINYSQTEWRLKAGLFTHG